MAENESDSEESSDLSEDENLPVQHVGDPEAFLAGVCELYDTVESQSGEASSSKPQSCLCQDERDTLADLHTLVRLGEQGLVLAELDKHKTLLDRDITCSVEKSSFCVCHHQFEEFTEVSNEPGMVKWILEGRCSHDQVTDLHRKTASKRLIHVAAATSNISLLNYLLDQGCDVDAQTGILQLTPVFLSIEHNHTEATRLLITRGANINKRAFGSTPLMEAVEAVGASMVTLLLESTTCNVNEISHHRSETALILAASHSDLESVQALLAAGADPNIGDKHKMTPLLHTAYSGRADIAETLIKAGAEVNSTNYRNESPLLVTVHQNDRTLMKLLLEAGAEPDVCSHEGFPALVIASYMDCVDMVRMLLQHGADINIANKSNYTSVHVAAWDGLRRTVEVLLLGGAEHDSRTLDGNTPLSLAAHGNYFAVIKQLLPLGCAVNNSDKDQDTALHYAAYNGCLESVRTLVLAGADPNVRNRIQTTALWNAIYKKNLPVVRYLLYLNVEMEVESCGINQHSGSAQTVLVYGTPKSPLWIALDQDSEQMIQLLYEAGYRIWSENWVMDCSTTLPQRNATCWLMGLTSKPPSLLHFCKMYFRHTMGLQIHKAVHELEIPNTMKSYLLLEGIQTDRQDETHPLLKYSHFRNID